MKCSPLDSCAYVWAKKKSLVSGHPTDPNTFLALKGKLSLFFDIFSGFLYFFHT